MRPNWLPDRVHSRLAPTPSGYLHIGNLFNFVLCWLFVRKTGGSMRLRIDDIDGARKRPEYVRDIFQKIAWLGIDYDLGPTSPQAFEQHYSQHLRLPRYAQCLTELKASGGLFACTCSRKQIVAQSHDGSYPGTCHQRNLPFDAPKTAWRIRTPMRPISLPNFHPPISEPLTGGLKDFVVMKKDGLPAYHLVSVADDLADGVNFLVRGEDLLPTTAAQRFLSAQADSLATFGEVKGVHHPLLRSPSGEKLSKSAGKGSSLAENALPPLGDFYLMVGQMIGLAAPTQSLQALLEAFDPTEARFGRFSG